MGGFGGQSAQAPTMDLGLNQQQIDLVRRNLGSLSASTGAANRDEIGRNVLFGLSLLDDSGETLNRADLTKLRKDSTALEKRIAQTKNAAKRDELQGKLDGMRGDIAKLSSPNYAVDRIRGSFAEQYGMRDELAGRMGAALGETSEYQRMQQALGRGITAQETDAGALGDQLMRRASDMVAQGGQLSPEAARDAVQSARSGMAARGLATGNAGLAAELLNRDRYSRQREFENLGFAQGVQTQDLARRQNNASIRDATNRFNMGLLGQSAGAAEQERARQLAVGSDRYNFMMATDPKLMAAGIGNPYANLTGSVQSAQSIAGNIAMNPMYSGGQFSSSNNMAGNMLAGGLSGAAALAPTGNPYAIGAGFLAGTASGAFGR